MPRNEITPLLTVQEVAEILRIAPKTVRNKVSAGQIPAVRIAGSLRFRSEDIQRLIDDRPRAA